MKKNILKSKTMWVNVLSLLILIMQQVSGWEMIPVKPEMFAMILAGLNMVLRYVTTTAINFPWQGLEGE